MRLGKSLIVILSLFLCFCVLSKQANASYAMDYDIPSFVEVHVEACNDHDSGELTAIQSTRYLTRIVAASEPFISNQLYLQPDSSPLLRPPAV